MRKPGRAPRTVSMTEGPVILNVLTYAVPIIFSSLLQLFFNAADTVVVGQFSGKEALAAVGSVSSLNNMIISLFIGLSIGANVLVASYSGARLDREVSDTVHTSVLLSLTGGLLLGIIGISAARPLLQIMGSPEDVLDLAVLYVRILFAGMPAQMLYNFSAAILRAVGDTRRPLYFLTVSGVVNVLLNLLFVIPLQMSVAGVALATILSQALAAAMVTRSLMTAHGPIRLRPGKLRFHGRILRRIFSIGVPAGIQSMLFSLSNVIIQSSVNSFGTVVVAANAAAANLGNFVYQAMNAFQQTITSFAGQNLGAGKPGRVIESLRACLMWVTLFGVVLGLLSCVFVRPLLSLFSSDPEVIEAGILRIYTVNGPYALCGVMDVMTGVMRGIGYSTLPMLVSLMGACVFRILWILLVFPSHRSIFWLMLSYPVSWLITFLVLAFLFSRLWKRLASSSPPPAKGQG